MICLVFIIFVGLVQDIFSYKVKNKTILLGLIMGSLFLILNKDLNSTLNSIIGMMVPILILSPLFLFRMLGAGDIKLFSVIGLFLGAIAVTRIMLVSIVIGGILSFIKLVKNKNIKHRVNYFIHYMRGIYNGGSVEYYDAKTDNYKNALHFTIAIFMSLCHHIIFDGGVK